MSIEHDQAPTNKTHPLPGLGPYANLAARLAASPGAGDIGKAAIQSDTLALWELAAITPAFRWQRLAGSIPINVQAGAYTLALSDVDGIVQMTSGSGVALTFPLSSAILGIMPGDSGLIYCDGAGAVTCTPASGSVHLRRRGGSLVSNGQYSVISWTYKGSEEWTITGDTV